MNLSNKTKDGVGRITGRLSPKVWKAGGDGRTHSRPPLTPLSLSGLQGFAAHFGP
jgi:hypothetical protein